MDLATIEMPAKEARAKFLEYRRSVRERHNDEDEAIMRGYRWLSKGLRLIHLPDTIKAGGRDEQGLPRLAVARADLQWIYGRVDSGGRVQFHRAARSQMQWQADRRCAWSAGLCLSMAAVFSDESDLAFREGVAMVPVVPPALRPANLRAYHVLFEAEWTKVPPKDPALLRRVGGDLWAVVAVWDLTELERAVLSGRAHP